MLSRDSEEDFEDDDIEEGLGIASTEGSGQGESCSEVTTASKEEVKGAAEGYKGSEEGYKGAEGYKRAEGGCKRAESFEHKGGQSPTQPKQDVRRLRDNVT